MFKRKWLCNTIFFFALLLICVPATASTEWLQTRGPEGGDISVLVIDPTNSDTIYAGLNTGGIFKSTDGGASWNAINSELLHADVYGIVIDPANSQTIYCQAGGGLFKSTDGGMSWSTTDIGLPDSVGLPVFDPSDSQTIYVWASSGLIKSSNGGATWSAASNGLNSLSVCYLVIDPTNSQTLYAWSWQDLFKSTDGGTSWNALASGQPGGFITSFAIDPTNGHIYVASNITSFATDWDTGLTTSYAVDAGVFKSTDGGATWSAPNNALNHTSVRSLAIDPTNSQTIYAGTFSSGVFKSTDGGATWSAVNNGLLSTADYIVAIDPTNSQNIYTGSAGGIAKSTNGGASWIAANRGIVRSEVLSLAVSPANDQAIYAGTKGGVFKSSNRGGSWIPVNNGLNVRYVGALVLDPTSPQTIYAGTDRGMFKSTNGGDSWSAINTGILAGTIVSGLAIDRSNSQNIYISAYHPIAHTGGVFKSTNGGATWSAVNGVGDYSIYNSVVIDPTNSQTIYVAASVAVFKSTDGGATWSASIVGSYPDNYFFSSVAIDPADGQTVYVVSRQGVLKSTNGGGSWSLVNSVLFNANAQALAVAGNRTLYVGTRSGVFKTTDGGSSWNAVNSGQIGAANVSVQALAIDPTNSETIYAGTNHGVFKGISTPALPTVSGIPVTTATVGIPYSFTPASTNAATFSITGSVPPGLSLDSMTGTLSGTPTSVGTYGDIVMTATNANGSVSLPAFTISVSAAPVPQQYPLTLTFAGNGGGSVNGGVSCSNGEICALPLFVEGANLTLMPSPNANSLFGGWSGDCTVTGNNCSVTMDGAKSVTATFNAAPPLRILGGATYELLSSAYAAAANNAVIQTRALSFDSGELICDRPVSVFFIGGYNADFSLHSGATSVRGRLLVRKGTVRVSGLVLK